MAPFRRLRPRDNVRPSLLKAVQSLAKSGTPYSQLRSQLTLRRNTRPCWQAANYIEKLLGGNLSELRTYCLQERCCDGGESR